MATSCQVIPFPPPEIGMEYSPDENNKITLASEFNIYNPRLPMNMDFPGPEFCSDNGHILLIIGSIPEEIIKPRKIIWTSRLYEIVKSRGLVIFPP